MDSADALAIILEFVGFTPARFVLRQVNRVMYDAIPGVVELSEDDFIEALCLKCVNHKLLRYKGGQLNDEIVYRIANLYPGGVVLYFFFKLTPPMGGLSLSGCSWLEIHLASVRSGDLDLFEFTESMRLNFLMHPSWIDSLHRTLSDLDHVLAVDNSVFLKCTLRRFSLDYQDWVYLLHEANSNRAVKCIDVIEKLGEISWINMYNFLNPLVEFEDILKLNLYLRYGDCSVDDLLEALQVAAGRGDVEVIMSLQKHLHVQLKSHPAPDKVLATLLSLLKFGTGSSYPVPHPMAVHFLLDRCEDLTTAPGAQLEGLCALEHSVFATRALERGASNFDFKNLMSRLRTHQHAEWVVQTLEIEVSRYHVTDELSRRINLDILEYLFDHGIGSFSIFDWLKRSKSECCFANRGLSMVQKILDRNPTEAFAVRDGRTVYGYLDSLVSLKSIWKGDVICVERKWDGNEDFYHGMSRMRKEWEAHVPNVSEIRAIEHIKELLVARGANRDQLFTPDAMARYLSQQTRHRAHISTEIIDKILNHGGDVNGIFEGKSAIMIVGDSRDVVEFLIQRGAK
jgi:hypothetical protein